MNNIRFLTAAAWVVALWAARPLLAQPILGDAPRPPVDVSGLPGAGPLPLDVTGGFSVNTFSREQSREFYNAIFAASDGVPMDSTADTSSCFPGTNSSAFADATLLRLNWFRAMAGIPAAITFDATESTQDQQAAVIMSSNNRLQHTGSWVGWSCVTQGGTNAAGNSNLDLGGAGPDAIVAYVWDFGANNYLVGHRRSIFYPQTRVMATGGVPLQGTNNAANATWAYDANYGGPRPATRTPYIAWPPAGYVPYQVVFPQWSFALSNANFSTVKVAMWSNGVPLAVTVQPYVTGYGENTAVWYSSTLNPSSSSTFPFGGADTVYTVSVSNVVTGAGTKNFTYTVTLFDPAVPGADYFPPAVSGPSTPGVNLSNAYNCVAITNATSYQWLVSQIAAGNVSDNAQNGLTNFTISPPPNYSIITASPDGSGNCFHLAHVTTNDAPQLLQLRETVLPGANTTLSFQSMLRYATATETARVQISADTGQSWADLFTKPGSDGPGDSAFTNYSLSLSSYAGTPILLRFNYDAQPYTSYYTNDSPYVGWFIKNISLTNAQQLLNTVTNATASTNFIFTPAQAGPYSLQARALIFTDFPLGWGPIKQVTAVAAGIVLSSPIISGGQMRLDFNVAGGMTAFKLLQAAQLPGPWTTNASAVLTTNVPGSSYRFTTPAPASMQFYRVMSP